MAGFGPGLVGFFAVRAAVVNADGISLEFPRHEPRVAAGP